MTKRPITALLRPTRLLAVLLCLALLSAGTTTAAQEDGAIVAKPDATTREMVENRLADMKERLALDDYQWTQVEMILKSSIRERVAIIRRYGLDGGVEAIAALEGAEKRAMKRELKDTRKETEKRMKRYLDKDQYKEFKAIQEEIHDELIARVESAQAA
ncbi:MAG: hypothetical protein V2I57_10460 [Xanthomonadales bacterium]|jgi:hypothetical protein|nr:hypothetical protein [Xanthomonadales bacterium]